METRLYLNDWGSYNSIYGCGYGWMTATQAREFLENANDDKEWFFADIDTDLDGLKFNDLEYCNVYNVIETIETLEALDEYKRNCVIALMEYDYNDDLEGAINNLDNYYFYSDCDCLFEEYDELLESECPEHIQCYIDWEKYHDDLMYDFYEASNGIVITR